MNIRRIALAVLVTAVPAIASPQEAAPAAASPEAVPAAASPRVEGPACWTIGAGISGIGEVFLVSPSSAGIDTLGLSVFGPGTSIPVATLFLERRIGERTWLTFAGAGTVSRERIDPPPGTSTIRFTTLTETDAERVSASVGLRRVVTRPGAIVDVSLAADVEGGYVHVRRELASSVDGARTEVTDTGGFASLSGGIAVERTLSGALALRISTPLVGATWSRVDRKDDAGTRFARSFGLSVVVAPRIELRLAF